MDPSEAQRVLPRLLTAKEVSEQLRIPLWRLYERVRAGDLPVVRIGTTYRFSEEAVSTWVNSGGSHLHRAEDS